MARKTVHSDDAPKAIGPYSQAVQVDAGKMTFLSGQIPLDPKTMEMVTGDVVAQTEQVMKNLRENPKKNSLLLYLPPGTRVSFFVPLRTSLSHPLEATQNTLKTPLPIISTTMQTIWVTSRNISIGISISRESFPSLLLGRDDLVPERPFDLRGSFRNIFDFSLVVGRSTE